jgi:rod shape-determining protein MreC
MHRLVEFLRRIYVVLIFLLLEGIAIWQYATSSPYTEAKIFARTTAIGGAISEMVTDVEHFFSLPDENRRLTEYIAKLEEEREHERELMDAVMLDSLAISAYSDEDANFRFSAARVSSSTSNRQRNYIVLDRGARDGMKVNMGVMTPERHMVGYITSCSDHYSVVEPIISTKFTTGGRLMDNVDNGYFCSDSWDGSSRYHAIASDISVNVDIAEGMTIEVSSERMPRGVVIGTIESYDINSAKTAYSAEVKLAADMSAIDNVIVVEGVHYNELATIIEEDEEEKKK